MRPSNSNLPPSTTPRTHSRQALAPVTLTSLLTFALIAVGYVVVRQAAAAGMTAQNLLAALQKLWPFTVDNLSANLQASGYVVLTLLIAFCWLISVAAIIISRYNRTVMLTLFGLSFFSFFLLFPFVFSGMVLLADLLMLFLVGLVGNLFFDERITARFMTLAIGVGMIALVLDIFIPWQRPLLITGDILFVFYGVVIVAFAVVIALGFQHYPLRQKLIFVVMAVSVISIVVVVLVSINSVEESIENTANQALLTASSQTIANIEGFFSNAFITLETEAQNTLYINYLLMNPEDRTDNFNLNVDLGLFKLLSRRTYSTREAVSHLRFLQGVSLVDIQGEVLRDTEELRIGQSMLKEVAFLETLGDKGTYVSSIQFDAAGLPIIMVSTEVSAPDGTAVGVLIMRYDGNLFQQLILESNNLAGLGSYAMLVDANYFVQLANALHPELNFKTPLTLTEELVAEIQAQGVVPIVIGSTISSNQGELVVGLRQVELVWEAYLLARDSAEARLAELPESEAEQERLLVNEELKTLQQNLSFTFPDPNTQKPYLAAYSGMELVPWVVVYSQSREYFLEPLRRQVQNIQLLALAVALIAAGLAFFLAQVLAAPIGSLTQVASSIASGDFSRKAPVEANDEIGKLAQTINTMADQLSLTVVNLEQRVEQRTSDLTRRSAQMQAAAEVGRAAANLRNINELLPQVCQLISERFGFYHVGIFLLDANRSYAVLRAANSEGGQRMLNRGHRLGVGQQGIVGNVTATGQPRIALDVGEDAVFFNNPDLPQTRSEAALPLQVGGRIIGALDVQSTESAAFTSDDIVVLRVMADLVATAIENARLFEESQQALEISRRAYGEISRQGWSDFLQTQTPFGYRSTEQGIFQVQTTIDESRSMETEEDQDYMLSIPIWVRNTITGYLKTRKPHEKGPWTIDEVEAVAKVVEQLSGALESARLYQSSQVNAERERMIGEITSRMRDSLDVDAVLQVAAQQIRQALDLKQVTVALGSDSASGFKEPGE